MTQNNDTKQHIFNKPPKTHFLDTIYLPNPLKTKAYMQNVTYNFTANTALLNLKYTYEQQFAYITYIQTHAFCQSQ